MKQLSYRLAPMSGRESEHMARASRTLPAETGMRPVLRSTVVDAALCARGYQPSRRAHPSRLTDPLLREGWVRALDLQGLRFLQLIVAVLEVRRRFEALRVARGEHQRLAHRRGRVEIQRRFA